MNKPQIGVERVAGSPAPGGSFNLRVGWVPRVRPVVEQESVLTCQAPDELGLLEVGQRLTLCVYTDPSTAEPENCCSVRVVAFDVDDRALSVAIPSGQAGEVMRAWLLGDIGLRPGDQ